MPEGKFCKMTEFYSFLKNKIIKPDESENEKNILWKMRMKKLLDLNTSKIFKTQFFLK